MNRNGAGILMVRVDAGPDIGAGHAMRCMALAQAWRRQGGEVLFLMSPGGDPIQDRLRAQNICISPIEDHPGSPGDADQVKAYAHRIQPAWIVADGYQFGVAYQERLKAQAPCPLLYLDDYGHLDRYVADLVLNQNISARRTLYRNLNAGTELLLGIEYALLREEFSLCAGWQRRIPKQASNILITFGGSDGENCTRKAIEALRLTGDVPLDVKVIVGPLNQHAEEIKQACSPLPHTIKILRHVDDMAAQIRWADLAISGAGSTCWEMAFMGLPALLVIQDTNQEQIALRLGETEVAGNLGWWHELDARTLAFAIRKTVEDEALRNKMSGAGHMLVDGRGADRVIGRMGRRQCNA